MSRFVLININVIYKDMNDFRNKYFILMSVSKHMIVLFCHYLREHNRQIRFSFVINIIIFFNSYL